MGIMTALTSKGGTGHLQQSICLQRPTISFWRGFALLIGFFAVANSQDTPEIGVDICFCSPSTYEFTLDFSLFCPPVNITLGDAVQRTSCAVNPFGTPDVSDLVPVAVSSIEILELDQGMQVSVREKIEGSFGDGDTFQYTSIAALPGEIVNPDDLPRAIQLNIVGVNQFDESIINIYLIIFTNNCGRYPVLFEGQSAGWTRFSDLQPPSSDLCPLAPTPTLPPTPVPGTPSPTAPAATPSPTAPAATPGPTTPAGTPSPTTTSPAPTQSTPPPFSPPPTQLTAPPTSMSMSMSMDLMDRDMDLLSMIIEMEDGEFGLPPEMKERLPLDGKLKKQKKDPVSSKGSKASKASKANKKTKKNTKKNTGTGKARSSGKANAQKTGKKGSDRI